MKQGSAWSDHSAECQNLKKVQPKVPADTARLIARILHKKKSTQSTLSPQGQRCRTFESLMTHKDTISTNPLKIEHFTALCHVLKDFMSCSDDLTAAEIMDIYAKILINCISITDDELNIVIGSGLYIELSVLNHSCIPDCALVFQGPKAILNLLNPDKGLVEGSIDNLTINYIDLLATTSERRSQLESQYYFTCDCALCQNTILDAIKTGISCSDNQCDGVVITLAEGDMATCQKCRKSINDSNSLHDSRLTMHDVKWTLDSLDELNKTNRFDSLYDKGRAALQRCKAARLHRLNVYLVKLFDKLYDCALELQKFDEACDFISNTLEAYELYYPKNHPAIGLQYLKFGKLAYHLERLDDARMALEKAEKFTKISHGEQHSVYKAARELFVMSREEARLRNNQRTLQDYFCD